VTDVAGASPHLRLFALGAVTIGAAIVVGTVDPDRFAVLTASVLVLALGLAMPIPIPWGGSVPLGYALVIPLAAGALSLDDQVLVATLAVAIVLVDAAADRGCDAVPQLALRLAPVTAGTIGASALVAQVAPAAGPIGRLVAASVVLVVLDAAVAGGVVPRPLRIEVKSALPVYLAVVSVAALATVTIEQVGILMAGVAVLPLLLARFSFQRYATANATLEQTVLALGFVPELVGLASMGQSERVASYADRIAAALGFDRRGRQRIVIAGRLHRLGAVRFDDDGVTERLAPGSEDLAALAAEGARILRRSGFPDEISELVEQAGAGSLEGPAPSLEATIIRVAVAFDAVVGDDGARSRIGLARVSEWATDRNGRRTVAALAQLLAREDGLVADAVAAGQRFRDATDDLDLERLFAAGRGEALAGRRRP
jgi:hypothetical protein